MACAVDEHPQRSKIIQWLIEGVTPGQVAKRIKPTISHVSLWRYRTEKIKPAMERASKSAIPMEIKEIGITADVVPAGVKDEMVQALVDDPLVSRISRRYSQFDKWLESAENKDGGPDHRALAALTTTELRAIELHARLTGRLDSSQVTNNTAILVLPQSQALQAAGDDPEVVVIDLPTRK